MPTTEKSPEFYKHYPALFHTYFPTVSAETLHLLCKAGYTYYNAVLCLDALVDEGDTKALVEMLALFEEEYHYFMERINPEVGAWQYFPTVQEIAPDIDDLAQIMQFFIHIGKKDEIAKHCQKAIDTAINSRSCVNGGIETWILPKHNLTPLQQKQQYFNENKWGTRSVLR